MKNPPSKNLSIYLLLGVGCGASLALALWWDVTSVINGKMRSTGLFICIFFLSLVDCTSSVLFLPYMGKFRKVYLNSFLFGEGMSGFVPSIAALAQGISGNPVCITMENGTSVIQQVTDQARFTTSDFFIFLLAMIILSLLAFLLLEYLPTARSERIGSTKPSGSNESVGDALHNTSPDAADEETISHEGSITPLLRKHQTIKYNIYLILSIQCFVCFLSNGALPSIQSYSCLPYGEEHIIAFVILISLL